MLTCICGYECADAEALAAHRAGLDGDAIDAHITANLNWIVARLAPGPAANDLGVLRDLLDDQVRDGHRARRDYAPRPRDSSW